METQIQTVEPNPLALINIALEKGMDVDKLTRLFDLQERWEKKEAEKSFLASFANFQRTCPKIRKTKMVDFQTKTGGRLKYSYAPLSEITEQIKEALTSNMLSYRWEFSEEKSLISCKCIVSHADGHSKISEFSAPKDDSGQKNAIQQIGSTHTYLQRYTLIGALGISSADDDVDGRQKKEKEKEKSPQEIQASKSALEKWKKEFEALKTPTEIKINSNDFFSRAEKDGAPIEELRQFALSLYAKLNAETKKAELKKNEGKPAINLP